MPTEPTVPTHPTCPTEPTVPTEPTCPTQPTCPAEPVAPSVDHANATWLVTGNDAVQKVSVTGWAPAGSAVMVVLGGMTVQATAGSNGRWGAAFEGPTLPADGLYRAQVSITTPGGVQHQLQGPRAMIDVTPPDLDLTEGTESTGHVFDAADRADGVELAGTAEPGARVTITLDGVPGGTATVWADAQGHWAATFPAGLFPQGGYAQPITVSATDALGNTTVTHDAVVIGTDAGALAVNPVTADNVANHAENAGGVNLTGTADPGAAIRIVVHLPGGAAVTASAVADAHGAWAVTLPAGALPQGEYPAVLVADANDGHGNISRVTHDFTVDTLVNLNRIDASTITGDGIVNAVEIENGFVLTGSAEPGAQAVTVHWEGVRRAATVNPDGTWSVAFGPGEIAGGDFRSAATVTVTDAAGNRASACAMIVVDTVAPEAAGITAALHGPTGLLGLGTDSADVSLSLVGGAGATLLDTTACAHPTAGHMHFFDQPLPDGSLLVVGQSDEAGNRSDTLVLIGDDGHLTLDLARVDLDGFQIAEIDLNFAPEANLVITEAQLRELSAGTDALVVHGDAQDTVTAYGAVDTGERVEIDGHGYHVYTLGDAGASLIVGEDVTVHTALH